MDAPQSKAKKPPAFQFYAKDFLTGTMEMSLLEIGAYTKFLAWSWDNGALPENEARRAAILGVSVRAMRQIWDGIGDKWQGTDAGFINPRLEHQRNELADFKRRQSDRGRSGATEKWRKHSASSGASRTQAMLDVKPDDSSAVSDLRSADPLSKERSEGERAPAPPLMVSRRGAGYRPDTLVSDHRRCLPAAVEACGRGLCVPAFLASSWVQQLRHSGGDPDAEIRTLVVENLANAHGPIGDPVAFWRGAWESRYGTPQRPKPGTSKVSRSLAAGRELIAEALNEGSN